MKRLITKTFIALVLSISLIATVLPQPSAFALSGSEFQAGRIMDDGVFFNGNGLSLHEIQSFLNAKVPHCDTNGTQMRGSVTRAEYGRSVGVPPPYTCLKDFRQTTAAKGAEAGLCNGYPALNQSAAEIIYNVAQSCGINPRVLLVLLQKEQSLITDDWPWPVQYRSATGYGCPDTAPCDSEYYGFFNQVYNAARQFKNYRQNSHNYNFIAGRNNFVGYNPNASCGGSNVFIQNAATAGLYNYTPYQPNTAALNNLYGSGDACSAYGNRNFWRMYNDWFGSTVLPSVFKGSTQAAVYLLVNGYKVAIPSMAVLQDYGFDPRAITTIDQSMADSTPVPPAGSGISTHLGSVVKSSSDSDADGGSVYLVSIGRKNPVTSMDQFNDFGFSPGAITYLPLSFITSLPSSNNLSNYVSTPTSNVFQVKSGAKRIILDGSTYTSLNPGGAATPVSQHVASLITAGTPITNSPILIGNTAGSISLLTNDIYHPLPSMDVMRCWGFTTTLKYPLHMLSSDSYVGGGSQASPLSCAASPDGSNLYLLNGSTKVTVPSAYGFGTLAASPALTPSINALPTRSTPLGQIIKAADNPSIWYLESGNRKLVPSMIDFNLLQLKAESIDTLMPGPVNTLSSFGMKLGVGQVVKANENGSVYAVTGPTKRTLIPSGELFMAYRYSWNQIISMPQAALDNLYPATNNETIHRFLYDQSSNKAYLVDAPGCYAMNESHLAAYGQSLNALQNGQSYSSNIFPNLELGSCKTASVYAKANTGGTVYWINEGKKHPFSSWQQLLQHSKQSSPYIIIVTEATLANLPTAPLP